MPTLFKSKTIESDLNYNLKDLNIKSGIFFLEVVPFEHLWALWTIRNSSMNILTFPLASSYASPVIGF